MQLLEFIEMYYDGNRSKFGRKQNPPVDRTTVNRWLVNKWTVDWDEDGIPWLSSPRRPLIKE